MIAKEFYNKVTNGEGDLLVSVIEILKTNNISYCVIGGLGVNAYVDPIVSLDLDIVIAADKIELLHVKLKDRYKIKEYEHSINIYGEKNEDLIIQIQTDARYQPFIKNASVKTVLGYELQVVSIDNIFQGKIWAATDQGGRLSKRKKNELDILRLIEVKKELILLLPGELKKELHIDNP